jgi:carbon starvation protein CstA
VWLLLAPRYLSAFVKLGVGNGMALGILIIAPAAPGYRR